MRVRLRGELRLCPRHPRTGRRELDAYYLGADEPLEHAEGRCVAIVHRFDDDDDKLVVIADGATPPGDDAILAAVAFQETPGAHSIIRC
ncbi:hypothetical protein ABZ540_05320 [Nocardia xishanensis]|uniref:hypothetical protein n=1 Tax=Nocardia xishanensis TaxID=238964 RepID=UPI0033FEAFAA